jgi:hypothetical protein
MRSLSPKKSRETDQALANLCGLLFICAGSLWGFVIGSWLLGNVGGVLGLTKWPRLSSIFSRKPARSSPPDSHDLCNLDEIHRRLKAINSHIWRELRRGVLSGCYAGLYSVQLDEAKESLDWREVNRRTVAALHQFETATTDDKRRASLTEALGLIGQKLVLVQKAALRKADKLNMEEEREIQKNEAELWRLSRLECLDPS